MNIHKEGQATNFMSQESHLPHTLQNSTNTAIANSYSLQQCAVTPTFYLFHISFLIVHIYPCIGQRKKVETNWGKKQFLQSQKKSEMTTLPWCWDCLACKGLDTIPSTFLSLIWAWQLPLILRYLKKKKEKAQWNTKLRSATTTHSWFFCNWTYSLIFIWVQRLIQFLQRFNSRNTVLPSFR